MGQGVLSFSVTRLSRTFRDRNKKTDMGNMTDMLPCKVKFATFWPVSTVPESFVTFVTHFPVSGKTNTIASGEERAPNGRHMGKRIPLCYNSVV